jgi:hypothetical protein
VPSPLHEILIEMFRHRPRFAAELLAGPFGLDLPAFEHARVEAGDFTDLSPAEYRADAVVVLVAGTAPVLAVVVEAQLHRDLDKRWSWPVYLTTLRARLRCPAALLVVCVDAAVGSWCAAPIELGHPGARVAPLVLGPERVPVLTDPEEAGRAPELAVLSAMAHGGDPGRVKVLDALLEALASVDEQQAKLYADVVLATLPVVARHYLEELMATGTYEYQSDFARRYVAEGKAEGKASAVLEVLDARGLDVPEPTRTRIMNCQDLDQLDRWLRRAVAVDAVNDLFA